MLADRWNELLLPQDSDNLWEVLHENSKLGRFDAHPPNSEVRTTMADLWTALPYAGYPTVALPTESEPFAMSLEQALRARVTARRMAPVALSLRQLATVLEAGYGETRDNADGVFPRPFRTVPSGGALYPLEIYVHTARCESLEAGIWHYNPTERVLRQVVSGDLSQKIGQAMLFPNVPSDASMVIFVTAIFERSVFKYGERGYRFVLLEAGHVAQNINLAATALGLGVTNIGGYFDREIDRLVGLDGLRQSTVYMIAVGRLIDATTPLRTDGT